MKTFLLNTFRKATQAVTLSRVLLIVLLVGFAEIGLGQAASATWALTTDNSVVNSGSITAGTATAVGVTYAGVSGTNGTYYSNWPLTASFNSGYYYQYTIIPTSCDLTVTSISLYTGRSGTGPVSASVYYSIDNFTTSCQIGSTITVPATPSAITTISGLNICIPNTTTMTVRVYACGATGSGGTFYNKSVVITGATAATCTQSSIFTQNFEGGATPGWTPTDKVIGTSAGGGATVIAAGSNTPASQTWVNHTNITNVNRVWHRSDYGTGWTSSGGDVCLGTNPPPSCGANGTSYSALFNVKDCAVGAWGTIETPTIDLSTFTSVTLNFYYTNYNTTGSLAISYSTDGSTWTAVSSYSVNSFASQWIKLYVTLPSAALVSTCQIRFTATAGTGTYPIGIDEISLTGCPSCVAPTSLTYSSNPTTYCAGVAITSNNPSNSGGAPTSYSVSPALPASLSLNTSTGIITGTPTTGTAAANYTVTATNACGSTNVAVNITISPAAPTSLTYSSNPATYSTGVAITNNTPSNSGGAPTSYSVSPALPAGLNLNTSTGIISGTPTAATAAANYTVTATNSCGSTNVAVNITITTGGCAAISTFPWSENFDAMSSIGSGIVPTCWLNVTGTKAWTSANSSTTTYNLPYSSPNYMNIAWSNTTASQLWTPSFHLIASTAYTFSFYYNTNGTSSSYIGFTGTVLENTSQSTAGATTLGTFITSIQGTSAYTLYSVVFTPISTGNYYFGLNVSSNSSPWYLGVDDFSLAAPCTPPATPTASVTIQPTCALPTGTIVISAPIGAQYEYQLDAGTYQASATFTLVAVGSHTVKARLAASPTCISPASGTLTVNAVPTVPATPTASVTVQPTCAIPTGTIVVSAPIGAQYEYQLDAGAFQSSATFTLVSTGSHTVTARFVASPTCISSASGTLTVNAVPAVPTTPIASVTVQPTCAVPTGTIVVSAPIGAQYEYQIDAGTYQASTTFTLVAVGSYTVTARLIASPTCISSASGTITVNAVPAVPVAPTASVTVQPTCAVPTGTIVISAPIGAQYEYQLDAGTYQASATFTLVAVGSHTVKARLAASPTCLSPASGTLTVNAVPAVPATPTASVTIQPTCSVSTGTIVISAPTGAQYEYQLDAGAYQASATFTLVAAGSHTVTARFAASPTCISSPSGTLTVNAQPTAPAAPTASTTIQPTCSVATGTIVVTAPTGAYEYNIDGGTYQASTTFSGVAAGSHNILVRRTTDNTCISTATAVTVNAQPTAPAAPTASTTIQPTCAVATGTIVVTAPTGAYEYNIDGGTYQASTTFSGVAAGSHNILVRRTTDNTCISTATAVTVNAQPTTPAAPTAGTHTPSQTQIVWNWNTVGGATGYKWNTVNNYGTATDMLTSTTKTETGLTCNTAYTRYIWAYNATCSSAATTLSQTTSACACTPPTIQATIGAYSNITTSSILVNWARGNGTAGVIVVARLTATSAVDPSSGAAYTANAVYGSGNTTGASNYVVYNGTGTSVNVTGLTDASNYTFTVYEFNSSGTCYLTPGSGSAVTSMCTSPTTLYTQNFGTGTSFPTGWSASNLYVIATGGSTGYTGASGGSNVITADVGNPITCTLDYNNSFSTSGYSNITVLWGARRNNLAGHNLTMTFQWSSDGSTWNTVPFTDVAVNGTWALVNGGARIALPVGAENQANLRFRWSATGDATDYSYRFDDFSVQGCIIPCTPVITGTPSVCVGSTTTLTGSPSGGTWTSSNTGVATVSGGVVTGVAAGTSTITYTKASCFQTMIVTVYPTSLSAPVAATHTPSLTQIIWDWNDVAGASGYQWNTNNSYPGVGVNVEGGSTFTQTGLSCNTSYTIYVWAFNSCGHSSYTTFTQSTTSCSEMIVPSTGSNTYTVCSGNLYDAGGSAGNYNINWSGYTVLYPGVAGNAISITGTTAGESCCDYIYIYDGINTSAPLLGTYIANYGTIPPTTATNVDGALTVQFVSDFSVVGAGFNLTISCDAPGMVVPFTGNNSYTTCSGHIYDHGGNSGDYNYNANGYTVIYPTDPGMSVMLTGTYDVEPSYDYIYIYDGAGTSGTLLGTFSGTGNQSIGTIISSGPNVPLTIKFTSDYLVNYSGFDFTIQCYSPCTTPANPANPTAGASPACASTTLTEVAAPAGVTFYWQGTNSSGTSTTSPASSPYTVLSSGTYYVRAQRDAGGCWSAGSGSVAVTVNPNSSGGIVTGGATICAGSTSGILTLSGYTGSITKWQYSIDNFSADIHDIANTSITYTSGALATTTYFRAVVTSSPCGPAFSTSTTVTVSPASVGGSISGGSTPICLGSGTGTFTVSGYTGTVVKWQKRVNAGAWTDITNALTTYSETPSSAGAWEYRAGIQSGGCAIAYSSNSIIINVLAATVGGSVTGGTTPICLTSNTGVMTLSGNTGTVVKWQKRVNAGAWTDLVNTLTTYSEVPSSSGIWDYRAVVQSSPCSQEYSAYNTIIVNSTSTITSVTATPSTIFAGSSTNLAVSGTLGYGADWHWYTSCGSGAVGTGSSISVSPGSTITYYVRAESSPCASTVCLPVTVTVGSPPVGVYNYGAKIYIDNGAYIYIDGDGNGDFTNTTYSGSDGVVNILSGNGGGGFIRLEGDWTNTANAGNVFASNYGTVEFLGTNNQLIDGNSTYFNNLKISGSGIKTLNVNTYSGGGYAAPSGVLTLATTNTPVLDLNQHTLIVTNPAIGAISSSVTAGSGYIKSETNLADNPSIVQWNMGSTTGDHVFPFGTNAGYYIPVTFNNNGNTSGNVSISTRPTAASDNIPWASMYDGSATTINMNSVGGSSAVTSVIDRWWDIQTTTNPMTGSGASLSFTYLGTENTMTPATDEIVFQHWSGTLWNDATSTSASAGTYNSSLTPGSNAAGPHTVSASGFKCFSPFILSRKSHPLPVELLSFTANCNNNKVELNWSTASESNNDYFSINKSKDLNNWYNIGTVAGSGTTNSVHDYYLIDNSPFIGKTYYQLKQVDFDAQSETFDPALAECTDISDNTFEIVGTTFNEAHTEITVSYNIPEDGKANIYMIDAIGQQISSISHNSTKGINTATISLQKSLVIGIYMVTIEYNDKLFTQKIFIH